LDRDVSKRTVFNLSKYLLAFGLLAYVVHANWSPESGKGLDYVWQRHVNEGQPIHMAFLLQAGVLYLTALLIAFFRWYVLVRAQSVPFTIAGALRLGMIGVFFNTFLPGAVGGDIIKAAALARERTGRTLAAATVIMDRAIALWALIWLVTILGGIFWAAGMLEGDAEHPAKIIVSTSAGLGGVSAIFWLLLGLLPAERTERFVLRLKRRGRVGAAAAEFCRVVWMYRCRQGSVALALVLSLIAHVVFVASFHCAAHTLWDAEPGNLLPSLTQHFLIVPIGTVILMVPLFPGGAGIGELGFGGLYAWFQCPAANGVLASLVVRVIGWVIGVVGLIVYSLPGARPTPDAELVPPVGINPVPPAEEIPITLDSDPEAKEWLSRTE
jgi:uncharacterized protein (TIRG00374 family)